MYTRSGDGDHSKQIGIVLVFNLKEPMQQWQRARTVALTIIMQSSGQQVLKAATVLPIAVVVLL